MLTLVNRTEASKLGPIAATYRAAHTNPFGTCPASCPLLPLHKPASSSIDFPYLEAVWKAIPKKGLAWTYTHFPHQQIPHNDTGTLINVSTDTLEQALESHATGHPTVYAAPHHWTRATPKYPTEAPIRFVECPANLNRRITCSNCGNGRPLCARPERDYVIVFPGHGSKKKSVGTDKATGACYGANGPIKHVWNRASEKTQDRPDGERLLDWVKTLPYRSYLRHHVVGDLGHVDSK